MWNLYYYIRIVNTISAITLFGKCQVYPSWTRNQFNDMLDLFPMISSTEVVFSLGRSFEFFSHFLFVLLSWLCFAITWFNGPVLLHIIILNVKPAVVSKT